MTKRLYEEVLPLEIEYFVCNVTNGVDFLREAEQVSREKFAVEKIFKNAINGILKVTDKFEKPLDMSKGDIKKVVGSKELLETINKLTENFDPSERDVLRSPVNNWKLEDLITLSRKTYLYISNLTPVFTRGYRDNNLFIINYYKALVSNLFALIGEVVSYTVTGEYPNYKSLRVTSLRDFVLSYEKGEFTKFLESSKALLEEYGYEDNKVLYESYDIIQSGVRFVKKLINNVDRNDVVGNFIYKAVEFVKQIIQMKQMIWPLVVGNLLPKLNDYINMFKDFVMNDSTTGFGNNTTKLANQIISNASRADDKANYLISVENNNMYNDIKKEYMESKKEVETIDDFVF